jgi:hypothetical protein
MAAIVTNTGNLTALAESAAEQGKRWVAATESVRARTDVAAKSIGALGTLGLGAISLNKFSDIFPLPRWPSFWQILAVLLLIAGLLAMAAAVALITARLWRVSAPIFMSPQLERVKEDLADPDPASWKRIRGLLSGKAPPAGVREYERVRTIYNEVAALNDADSLEIYAARGARFERIAQDLEDASLRQRAEAHALQIRNDVIAAQNQAHNGVVRFRATDALLSKVAAILYAMFVVGLIAFGLASDYLDSEREGRVASAKSCAEAIKAIKDADAPGTTAALLPKLCGGKAAAKKKEPAATPVAPTPAGETSGAVRDLGARYDACVLAAKGDDTACAKLKNAIQAAMG